MLNTRFATLIKKLPLFICTVIVLSSAPSSYAAQPVVGKTYHTAYNFMFEKGRHVTTNYWRGEMIPVNTKVTVQSIGKKKMVLSVNGQEIKILNVAKHTKKTMEEVADKLLSNNPVSLGGEFAKSIKYGEMRLGMTKNEVIKTRGYPPAHKTFSTDSDRWTYWSSKFVQRSLIFRDGKLVEGRGLR